MNKKVKNIFLICTYLLIIFLFIFGTLEIFIRNFVNIPDTFKSFNDRIFVHFTPNKKGIFFNTDGEQVRISINKDGFRDVNWNTNNIKYKIFFLGDSFVAGLQVPLKNTFVKLTKKYLSYSNRIECYNAGITGTGTGQQLIYYTNIIYKYKPNTVVLVVDYNDLYDSNFYLSWKKYTPRWSLNNKNKLIFHKPFTNPILYLSGHFKLITFLFFIYRDFQLKHTYSSKIANIEYKQKFSGPIIFDDFFLNDPPKIIEDAFKIEKSLINILIRKVKSHNVKFILVYLPADYQIEKFLNNNSKKFDFFKPSKFLVKIAKENKVPFIDLTYYFYDKYKKEKNWNWLHYKKDEHYNIQGHKFVAHILGKKIDNILKKEWGFRDND